MPSISSKSLCIKGLPKKRGWTVANKFKTEPLNIPKESRNSAIEPRKFAKGLRIFQNVAHIENSGLMEVNYQSIAQLFMLIFDKIGICVGTQWQFIKKKRRNVCSK